MGFGEVWWFLHDDGIASLEEALAAVRDAGLVAGNPATGTPEILDSGGRQVPWDAAAVGQRWAAGESITAQLWVNHETDVLVGLMRPHRLLTFDLDGMTPAEARLTVFAVLNAATSLPGTTAVIADRDLAEYDYSPLQPFTADLLLTTAGDGHYRLDIPPRSWLTR